MNSRIHLKLSQLFLCWKWQRPWSAHCHISQHGFHMMDSGFSTKQLQPVCEGLLRHQLQPLSSPYRNLVPCVPWELRMCRVPLLCPSYLLSLAYAASQESCVIHSQASESGSSPLPGFEHSRPSVQPTPIREPRSAEGKHWFLALAPLPMDNPGMFTRAKGSIQPCCFQKTLWYYFCLFRAEQRICLPTLPQYTV